MIVLTALPAMSLGAVHPTVQGVFFLVSALFMTYLIAKRRDGLPRIDLITILLLGLIAVTLLQLIPLPSLIVEHLAPSLFNVRSRALAPIDGAPPSFVPLPLDVPFTVTELGKLGLYTAVYIGAAHWTKRHGPTFILRLTALTGMAAASIFIAHRVLLLDKIYGFYVPLHVNVGTANICAPLVNANHMAGLLGLTTTTAIGCALTVTERSERFLLVGIAALGGGALMLTLSRGGIAAFVIGQILFFGLRLVARQRGHHSTDSGHLSFLPIGLAISLGLGFFAAQDAIIGEFVGGNIKKLDMAFEGIPLIAEFWPTGVGRGGFGVAFQMVSSMAANNTATHAENIIVQILADYGVPIGGAALMLTGIVIGGFLKSVPKRTDTAAALAALVAFGIHNLVDFNSEIPGVAVVAVALAGVLTGGKSTRHGTHRRHLSPWLLAGTATLSLLSGIVCLTYVSKYHRDTEERRLIAKWDSPSNPLYEKSAMKAALLRHPADWFIPYIKGVRAYHLKTENPLPWLARAIELNPNSALAHLYIGGTLLRAGHLSQALLELRLAVRSRPDLVFTAARLMVAFSPRFETLKGAAITRNDRLLLWPAIAGALAGQGNDPEAEKADIAILQEDATNPQSLARHARRLAERGDISTALILAKRLGKNPDLALSGTLLEAEIQRKSGALGPAVTLLEKGLVHHGNHPALLTELALAKQHSGDFKGAIETIQLLKTTEKTAERRALAVVHEANILLAEGRTQSAIAKLREAYALTPSNSQILERIADLSEKSGDTAGALNALRALSLDSPNNEKIKARLEALENALKRPPPHSK